MCRNRGVAEVVEVSFEALKSKFSVYVHFKNQWLSNGCGSVWC